ncbi:MAG: hypothetical protein IJW06_07770 [Clostridia bacterium]|nr:hypothetical protein [Clostridia bacterium]
MKKIRLITNVVVFCLVILVLSLALFLLPENTVSKAERRPLLTMETVKNNDVHIFDEIESYFLDQFPMRDSFRTLKAFAFMDIFRKNDNNDIYKQDGTVIKIEKELDEAQVQYTVDLMNKVVDKYFPDDKVYYSIVPDKHFYASKENGYPAMDYEKLFSMVAENLEGFEYIDITDKLALSDYYTTDSHWSQDKILGVAEHLILSMNPSAHVFDTQWEIKTLSPFYGVYYGQSALSLPPDDIKYLTNNVTEDMKMTVIDDMGKKHEYPVYVTEMFKNNDPYDVFAAGAQHLVIIENPNATNDEELVVFRDSFGSSIAPLLSCGYKKVTFVDLRYIVPDFIKQISGFGDDVDVLFLYSTGIINGGRVLKDFAMSPR